MHEADAIAPNLHEVGVPRTFEAPSGGRAESSLEEVDRRIREEGGSEHRLLRALRQLLDPATEIPGSWGRERLAGARPCNGPRGRASSSRGVIPPRGHGDPLRVRSGTTMPSFA